MDFKDILNKYLAPEGQEFKFSKTIIDDPQNEWDEIMNLGGGQPTYTLQNISKKQGLTSAPPSVYNRPDPRDMGPKFIPQEADVAVSIPTVEVPVVPTTPSGRNNAAQQERIRTAKAERAASQLRGGAQAAAQPSEELYRRNLSGRNLTVRGGPMAATSAPLQGEFIPRQERLSQIRPALPQPALEGEVVRSDRKLGTDPEWVRRLLQLSRGPALAAFSPRLLADDTYMDGMMGGSFEGFSFVPPTPDYTLGGMLRPQSFDSVNDMLLNQYLEGIDPYAQLLYSRRINGLF